MKKKSYISFLVFMLIMCETFVSCSKDGDESNSITLTSKDYKPYTFSGDSIEYGYFDGVTYYRVTSEENKTLEVSRSVQESTFVKIPQNVIIDGIKHEVTSIRRGAFGFNYCNLIILPNSVTSIGDWAFGNCWSLTSLNIPERVTSIGDYAFFYCRNLTSLTIPSSVTSIGSNTFEHCENLTSLNIPERVTSIGDYAFFDCRNLTSLTIPSSVTSIGSYAFSGCI